MDRAELEARIWEALPAPRVKDIAEVVAAVDAILGAVDVYAAEIAASPYKQKHILALNGE